LGLGRKVQSKRRRKKKSGDGFFLFFCPWNLFLASVEKANKQATI
jgi:hypothetical protein